MPRDFIHYWSPATADYEIEERAVQLRWVCSNQFKRLTPGDTVWIVTCKEGDLFLLASVPVNQIVSWENAVDILGTDDIWDADYVAIVPPGEARVPRWIPIADLAPRLRFESQRDRLDLSNGQVDPQQLQTMRQLTDESAVLLRKRFTER